MSFIRTWTGNWPSVQVFLLHFFPPLNFPSVAPRRKKELSSSVFELLWFGALSSSCAGHLCRYCFTTFNFPAAYLIFNFTITVVGFGACSKVALIQQPVLWC